MKAKIICAGFVVVGCVVIISATQGFCSASKTKPEAAQGPKAPVDMARQYEEQGAQYLKAKNYELAIEAYKNLLKSDPRNAQAHYNLGLLYRKYKNDDTLAIYHFKKYLDLNPKANDKKEVEYIIKMLKNRPASY
jgi:Tfp pilus assembly protein PilF